MRLLPIPGAPGYRVDCENQVAYRFNGVLRKLSDRTKYKVVNIQVDRQNYVTTVFRMNLLRGLRQSAEAQQID